MTSATGAGCEPSRTGRGGARPTTSGRGPFAQLRLVTFPGLVTNLAEILLTIVDTALLGRFSTRALAAVALAAPVYIAMTMVVRGWATATQVLVARRYGADAPAEVGKVADIGLALGVAGGVALGVALFALAPSVRGVLGGDVGLTVPATSSCGSSRSRSRSPRPRSHCRAPCRARGGRVAMSMAPLRGSESVVMLG